MTEPDAAEARTEAPRRLLIVEDDLVSQRLMLEIAKLSHCQADVVADGRAAVAAVRDTADGQAYALVLMDIRLPGLSGLEATRAIRALPGPASKVPIVALTTNARPADAEASLAAGMNDHLVKPIDVPDLLAVIRRWLDRTDAE